MNKRPCNLPECEHGITCGRSGGYCRECYETDRHIEKLVKPLADEYKLENDCMQKEQNEIVYLAWYHNGFTDDPSVLLGVCVTKEIADSVIACHKKKRNRESEYRNRASWNVVPWTVMSEAVSEIGQLFSENEEQWV